MVLGKPSNKNPFLQSFCEILSLTNSIIRPSETKFPASITAFAFSPNSVPFLMASRNISPVEMCGIFFSKAMKAA